ncbi:MAG: flippase-like domain-containing protein [Gammaproteobacteria bacterium]|nr:flippase-like domain-containing protein [Gammaproteobacteria bacterium]
MPRQSTMPPFLQSSLVALLTVLLFALAIEWLVGWLAVISAWQQLPPHLQLVALPLLLGSYLLRAWRNYDYFSDKLNNQWWRCVHVTMLHNALNNLLPLRSGELSFPLLMRRHLGLGYSRTIPALLLMRLMDIVVLALLALFVSLHATQHRWWLLLLLPLPLAGLPLQGAVLRQLLMYRRRTPVRLAVKAMAGLPRHFAAYCRCYLMTWLNWVVKLGMLAWLLAVMSRVPLPHAFWGALGGELTSILPINPPAGLGSYEAGIVAGVALWQPPSVTLLAAAVNVHLLLLGSSLLAAMSAMLIDIGVSRARRL